MKKHLLPLALAACSTAAPPALDEVSPATEQQSAALWADVTYGSGDRIVPPFSAAYTERARFLARTVAASDAFKACVGNAMSNRYLNIDDPNQGSSRPVQIARAYQNLRETFAHFNLGVAVQRPGAGASAPLGQPGDHSARTITFYNSVRADYQRFSRFDRPYFPWNFIVDGFVHEFMHSVNYRHSDWTCVDRATVPPRACTSNRDCPGGLACSNRVCEKGCLVDADCTPGLTCDRGSNRCGGTSCQVYAECGWTSVCGGSGSPPAGMTYATAGDSHREFTAVKNGRRDSEYYLKGEPSAPYIYGTCAGAVFEQSATLCAPVAGGCGTNGLHLVTSWTGDVADPQTGASCACSYDPRHMISLRTSANLALYADAGGGGTIGTDSRAGWGAWQTFQAIEYASPDGWHSDEEVALKTHDGHFVSADFDATATVPARLRFREAGGRPSISWNAMVNIAAPVTGLTHYAYNNGHVLSWLPSLREPTISRQRFQIVEPRRHLVYLSTVNGTYVNVAPSGFFYNQRTRDELAYATVLAPIAGGLDPAKIALQTEAALFIVDWNAGQLADGDAVSFEIYKDSSRQFLSTGGDTGHVRQSPAVGPNETFIIHKLAPSSPGPNVAHGDSLSFRSSSAMYLTAMPPDYFNAQIRNFVPWEGPSQRFGVQFVHLFDLNRAAWW